MKFGLVHLLNIRSITVGLGKDRGPSLFRPEGYAWTVPVSGGMNSGDVQFRAVFYAGLESGEFQWQRQGISP